MDHAHHQQYTCPMHPEVIKNAPGKCPKCGVDLVSISEKANEQHGHQQHRNPRDVANLILFGKATYRKTIQNPGWATGYNVIALPLAAGILYNAGIMLSPAMGAVLMSVSTLVVAINAKLLKL